jgi:glutamate-1-semialdehyde 2,1-aminomutase
MQVVGKPDWIDLERIEKLKREEDTRFLKTRPRSIALLERGRRSMPRGVPMSWMDDLWDHPPIWVAEGSGAHFTDVDGHDYLDMHIADASAFCGHAPEPLVRAVTQQIERGNQFQLPGEDAIWVAEHLAHRYGLPKWQFTLSATQANTEVIRLARVATGRDLILVFDGKYHGHLQETMVVLEEGRVAPEMLGLPASASGQARVIQFNDVSALEAALARRDVALVLTEPALTNAGIIRPESGFHRALRDLTRATGTLLAIDETHTLVSAYGGLTGEWGLEPDFLTLGKSLAAGVPLATYGMTEALADLIAPPEVAWEATGDVVLEVATGGTLFANALSMAAGKAALAEVLTEEAFDRTIRLGSRVADGIEAVVDEASLPWTVVRLFAHSYYIYAPRPSRNAVEYRAAEVKDLRALMRVYLANRGIWEAGWWRGPAVSVAHTDEDVDRYLSVFGELVAEIS